MIKYELKVNTREIRHKDRAEICEGCTLLQNDQNTEVIRDDFQSEAEALKELGKYESTVRPFRVATGLRYEVKEYYVEKNTYDDDGEWIEGGDSWPAKMDTSTVDE